MRARPAWVRKLCVTLGIGTGLGFVFLGYVYFQLTADIDASAFNEPNALDAREAERKLGLYRKALAETGRNGFIRLSEIEINAYLQRPGIRGKLMSQTNAPASSPRLLESRLLFSGQDIAWYCWIRKRFVGKSIPLVWRRDLELRRETNRWDLVTKSMAIGKFEVPPRCWPLANRALGEVDHLFAEEQRWVEGLPLVELRTNAAGASSELRLYTQHPGPGPNRPKP